MNLPVSCIYNSVCFSVDGRVDAEDPTGFQPDRQTGGRQETPAGTEPQHGVTTCQSDCLPVCLTLCLSLSVFLTVFLGYGSWSGCVQYLLRCLVFTFIFPFEI